MNLDDLKAGIKENLMPKNRFIVIGEEHGESGARRDLEKELCSKMYGTDECYREWEYFSSEKNVFDQRIPGDPSIGRCLHTFPEYCEKIYFLKNDLEHDGVDMKKFKDLLSEVYHGVNYSFESAALSIKDNHGELNLFAVPDYDKVKGIYDKYVVPFEDTYFQQKGNFDLMNSSQLKGVLDNFTETMKDIFKEYLGVSLNIFRPREMKDIANQNREESMIKAANLAVEKGENVVWKVGNMHVENMLDPNKYDQGKIKFEIKTWEQFNSEIQNFQNRESLKRNRVPSVSKEIKVKC